MGLIVFFNVPYTNHIFYQTFDLMAYFYDALISFGLCGLWLGWWLPKKHFINNLHRDSLVECAAVI